MQCETALSVLIGFKVKFTVILDGADCELDKQQNVCSLISFCYQFINASSGDRYRLRLRSDEQFWPQFTVGCINLNERVTSLKMGVDIEKHLIFP